MDEVWERAVEAALYEQEDSSTARSLTLDGAVKCVHGRLPPPALLEKLAQLRHLSIANVGVSSLADFPRLRYLEKLILSDNRIAGGLEFLVQAGLESLRDLDLSNNKLQFLEDLAPLAQLKLVSLDLYECPVTRIADYRARVFGMIKSLKYLDKADAEENERPETDEEDDDDEDDDDGGSGEIEGEERCGKPSVGPSEVDDDEEDGDESDEDEEENVRFQSNNHHRTGKISSNSIRSNGFGSGFNSYGVKEETSSEDEEDVEDEEEEETARFRQAGVVASRNAEAAKFGQVNEESTSDDEMEDEDDDEDDVENAEAQDAEESEDDEGDADVVEEDDDEDDDDDEDEDEDEEDVEEEEEEAHKQGSGLLTSTEGEIDAHEHDEDENGELGEEDDDDDDDEEEEHGLEEEEVEYGEEDAEDEEEEEDYGTEYLVQPIGRAENEEATSDFEPGHENGEENDDEDDFEEKDHELELKQTILSKRKRSHDGDTDESNDEEKPSKH